MLQMFFVTSLWQIFGPSRFVTYHGLERGEEAGCPEDVVTTKTRRRNGDAAALKAEYCKWAPVQRRVTVRVPSMSPKRKIPFREKNWIALIEVMASRIHYMQHIMELVPAIWITLVQWWVDMSKYVNGWVKSRGWRGLSRSRGAAHCHVFSAAAAVTWPQRAWKKSILNIVIFLHISKKWLIFGEILRCAQSTPVPPHSKKRFTSCPSPLLQPWCQE